MRFGRVACRLIVLRVLSILLPACSMSLLAGVPAHGQGADSGALEELTVRGQRPEQLRLEIELAEDRMFEIFNALNSTDEFDIHCRMETRAGTKIQSRICLPNFAWANRAESAQAALANSGAGIAQNRDTGTAVLESRYRQGLLAAEMRKLAEENGELLRAMIELYELNARLDPQRFEALESRADE